MQRQLFSSLVFLLSIQTCFCLDTVKYQFTDTQMFYDLSTYNFAQGRDATYSFQLQARQGRQVHLYLFQNDQQQYKLSVYDGVDATAPTLSVQDHIPANNDLVEFQTPISSSGVNMFIVVTADQTNPGAQVDFQAMATDFVQPDGCAKLVLSVNKPDQTTHSFEMLSTQQASCYYVLHANDPTNNPSLAQNVVPGFKLDSQKQRMFKGLQTDASHQLIINDLHWEITASDKYLVLVSTDTIYVNFGWTINPSLDMTEVVARYNHGSLMTNDYYQDGYPNLPKQFAQTFTLNIQDPVYVTQLTYINLVGAGRLVVSYFLRTTPTVEEAPLIYDASTFTRPLYMTYTGVDRIVLKYTTPNRNAAGGSGVYFLYDDISVYTSTTAPTTNSGSNTSTAVMTIEPSVTPSTKQSATTSTFQMTTSATATQQIVTNAATVKTSIRNAVSSTLSSEPSTTLPSVKPTTPGAKLTTKESTAKHTVNVDATTTAPKITTSLPIVYTTKSDAQSSTYISTTSRTTSTQPIMTTPNSNSRVFKPLTLFVSIFLVACI